MLVAAPFAFLAPTLGTIAVMITGSVLGLVAVVAVVDAVRVRHPGIDPIRFRHTALIGGSILLVAWADIAVRTAHLDDALALAATAIAVDTVVRRHPWLATAALAVAAAAKPWAIVFAPLALVVPGPHRALRPAVVGLVVALTWLPFVIDEPATVSATGRFTIVNSPASALRALHITAAVTPDWVRPLQITLGLAVACWLVATRRWPGIVMAGMAIRLMLDPGAKHYYAGGLVLGVLVWELLGQPTRLPWLTLVTIVVLEVTPSGLHPAALAGALRLVLTAALVAVALTGPRHPAVRPPGPATAGRARDGPDPRPAMVRET